MRCDVGAILGRGPELGREGDRSPTVWLAPLAMVAIGLALHLSGVDGLISDHFFDFSAGVFPGREDAGLELWGHVRARSVASLAWLCTLGAALASLVSARLRRHRSVLCALAAAMLLGPLTVVALKNTTSYPCPWNLQRYGGSAQTPATIFATPAKAGQCFPAGHSAGGFSFISLYFAAAAQRRRRLARVALLAAVVIGSGFSIVRIVQGAHFLSHAFWAAAIDWTMAALVFRLRERWADAGSRHRSAAHQAPAASLRSQPRNAST